MRKLAAIGMTLLVLGGVAACSSDSYDRQDAIDQLTEEGSLTEEQATCVVDGVEDEFGIAKLESDDDLTAEDEAALTQIMTSCMGVDLGIPTETTVGE